MILRLFCVVFLLCHRIKAIKVRGQDVTITAGNDAHLFCHLEQTTEPIISITWQRRTNEKPINTDFFGITSDGKEIHNGFENRVKFTGNFSGQNGSILLHNIGVLDEGIYTCIITLFPSQPCKAETLLTVQVPPVVTISKDVSPVHGDTEKILATCIAADSNPAAQVSWSLGTLSGSVKVQNNVTVDSEGRSTVKSSLIGIASKDLNQQEVQCLVTHPGLKEKLELKYELVIHYPPQLVSINSVVDQGESLEFQCIADANPNPAHFVWSRNFPGTEPISSGDKDRLIIQQTPDSNGLYYCVVSNQYGKAVGSLYVPISQQPGTCWNLIIILVALALIVAVAVVIRKHKLHKAFSHFIERQRCDPVNTDLPPPSSTD